MPKHDKLLGELVGKEFGYDNALIAPNRLTTFFEPNIDMSTHLSPRIPLGIPIASAAMDTVAEASMAIVLALEGGIAAVHSNFGPDLEENIAKQLAELKKVKRFRNGFIENPITLSPNDLIAKAAEINMTIPITEDGKSTGKLVGILGKNDFDIQSHRGKKVKDSMNPKPYTLTWEEVQKQTNPLEYAQQKIRESNHSSIPIVGRNGNLRYLVTRSDIRKAIKYPLATMDNKGRLQVLAAIETRMERAMSRMEATAPYVDGFVIDTAHAFFKPVGDLVREAKKRFKDHDIIVGNVSMPNAVKFLIDAGADGVRIGNGPGGGCTTWDIAGPGREQLSAIVDCSEYGKAYAKRKHREVYFNADGGIDYSGSITLALAARADTVTLGSLLAGTTESPGEIMERDGVKYKEYRGMGSREAMKQGGAERYAVADAPVRAPEGGVKPIPYRGDAHPWIKEIVQGVRQGMFKAGCRTIGEMHDYAQLIAANKSEKRNKAGLRKE